MSASRTKRTKLTPWFPAYMPPIRPGIYERDLRNILGQTRYSYYSDGKWWGWGDKPEIALNNWTARAISSVQDAAWRGLARRPR